jgi:uncharacterized membrane protein YfcA
LTAWIAIATVGVVAGTFIGLQVLERIPETSFRRIVALILLVLGAAMLFRGVSIA